VVFDNSLPAETYFYSARFGERQLSGAEKLATCPVETKTFLTPPNAIRCSGSRNPAVDGGGSRVSLSQSLSGNFPDTICTLGFCSASDFRKDFPSLVLSNTSEGLQVAKFGAFSNLCLWESCRRFPLRALGTRGVSRSPHSTRALSTIPARVFAECFFHQERRGWCAAHAHYRRDSIDDDRQRGDKADSLPAPPTFTALL